MEKIFISPRRRALLVAGATALLPARARSKPRPLSSDEALPAPLLAVVHSGQVEPSLRLVSEKYDGVRAVWMAASCATEAAGRCPCLPVS